MSFRKSAAGDRDFYAVEAAGLRWLAAAGGARVVEVLDVGPDGRAGDTPLPTLAGRQDQRVVEVRVFTDRSLRSRAPAVVADLGGPLGTGSLRSRAPETVI